MSAIVGVLLAAGGARRFGSQKLVAPLNGAPLVRHAASVLSQVTDTFIAVVGNDSVAVRAALEDTGARIVDNADWASGLASSLRRGIEAVPHDVDAVLVMLGDQPHVNVDVARSVVARWRETGCPIVAARYVDVRGHPVLFAREVFGELLSLTDDQGAKPVIERLPNRVVYVDVGTPAPGDVDTASDLRRLSP